MKILNGLISVNARHSYIIGSTEEQMIKRVESMLNNDFESFGIINSG